MSRSIKPQSKRVFRVHKPQSVRVCLSTPGHQTGHYPPPPPRLRDGVLPQSAHPLRTRGGALSTQLPCRECGGDALTEGAARTRVHEAPPTADSDSWGSGGWVGGGVGGLKWGKRTLPRKVSAVLFWPSTTVI